MNDIYMNKANIIAHLLSYIQHMHIIYYGYNILYIDREINK